LQYEQALESVVNNFPTPPACIEFEHDLHGLGFLFDKYKFLSVLKNLSILQTGHLFLKGICLSNVKLMFGF
jgi:hypothetical protein